MARKKYTPRRSSSKQGKSGGKGDQSTVIHVDFKGSHLLRPDHQRSDEDAEPPEPTPELEDLEERDTDMGNSRRFVRLHKENIRYVHAWKTWIIWTDQWKRDGQDAIMVLADDTVESMWREANDLANRDAQSKLRRLAHKSEALARRIAMVAGAQKDVALSVDKIDADPMLLGVENGVIDLRDGSFRAARREDFITKRCKVAYDPAARCPRWLEFLATIFPPDMPPYVQRVVGYTR